MANYVANVKTTYDNRSNSFPSRSHPFTASLEDHLNRLNSSISPSSSSSAIICKSLSSLRDLHECLDECIQLPSVQQILSHKRCGGWEDEVLDGSLRILNVCDAARDILLHFKESVQGLESGVRTKRGVGSDLTYEVGAYMISRKNMNKMVYKYMKDLKKFENWSFSAPLDQDNNLSAVLSILREVQAICLPVLKSTVLYTSGTKEVSRQSGWSLVSNLLVSKLTSSFAKKGTDAYDVEKIDGLLYTLINQKSSKGTNSVQLQNVLKQLQTLQMAIQDLEGGLESIFKCLVKTRVSLLNQLNR